MLDTYEKHARTKLITTVVAVLIIAGVVLIADHIKASSPQTATTLTPTSATTQPSPAGTTSTPSTPATGTASSGTYKDGTYTATSGYYVPSGQEEIQVSLALQNGVVTSASIQNSQNDRTSRMFQQDFASAYKQYVVGKKISSLQLSVIAGASDTTQGFNDAVGQIASKAQA